MHSRKRTWPVVFAATATLGALAASAAAGQAPAGAAQAVPVPTDAVMSWNAIAGQAALDACLAPGNDPLHEARMYAMTHIAIHDALNAVDQRSEPYAFSAPREMAGASPEAAVATAAHDVLIPLIGEGDAAFDDCKAAAIAGVDTAYTDALALIEDGNPKKQGVNLGHAAAGAILALRTGDGSDTALRHDRPGGRRPGCLPAHAAVRLPVRPGLGRRHAVRAERRNAVPPRPASPTHQPGLRRRPQRGEKRR